MPIKADHEIEVRIVGPDAIPLPKIEDIKMNVGETVRYSSPHGEVKIVFPGQSPFRNDNLAGTEVPGSVILTLQQGMADNGLSSFLGRCFVTPSGGTPVGWRSDPSQSGGDHHVHP